MTASGKQFDTTRTTGMIIHKKEQAPEPVLDASRWQRVLEFSRTKETPFQLILGDVIEHKYEELQSLLPYADIYYAVKANPDRQVITILDKLGSHFDVASIYEMRRLLDMNIDPSWMAYGNTIKKLEHIVQFYEAGIRVFATDSEMDLRNIAKAAPGANILVRILTEGAQTADWPLSRKFGCNPDMAADLLILARDLGLIPYGISFHVGSQQRDVYAWNNALAKVSVIHNWLIEHEGIHIQCINMGGGVPASYREETHPTSMYAAEISRFLKEYFPDTALRIIIEPGRSLVGDSGVLVSEIVLISRKSKTALERWVYQDCGKFSGLMETLDESIHYPIRCERTGVSGKVILAGPTCDSMDTMYQHYRYELPLDLVSGDRLYWISTGAYTASYSAVEFNGFPPLPTYVI